MKKISLPEAVEWRISDWLPAFEFVLDQVPRHLPQGARVLDMGHGTGKMSCFLAQQFDWQLEGLEINPTYYPAAQQLVDNCVNFNKNTFLLLLLILLIFLKLLLFDVFLEDTKANFLFLASFSLCHF